MAGINDVTGAVFTAAALAGNTQFKLDVVKAFAFKRVLDNRFIRNPVADTNDHGQSFIGKIA